MEIDLLSVIIGMVALATFFVPIGLYQYSQSRKLRLIKKSFVEAADKHHLQIRDSAILRDGIAIGIDAEQHALLHVRQQESVMLKLDDIDQCRTYTDQRKHAGGDGLPATFRETGLRISLRHPHKRDLKLPLFEGKEGSTFGDEDVVVRRWKDKIHAVMRKHELQT